MPDISMCEGGDCPLKDTCYRYKATPSEGRQSWLSTPPHKEGDCAYYWKHREEPPLP